MVFSSSSDRGSLNLWLGRDRKCHSSASQCTYLSAYKPWVLGSIRAAEDAKRGNSVEGSGPSHAGGDIAMHALDVDLACLSDEDDDVIGTTFDESFFEGIGDVPHMSLSPFRVKGLFRGRR